MCSFFIAFGIEARLCDFYVQEASLLGPRSALEKLQQRASNLAPTQMVASVYFDSASGCRLLTVAVFHCILSIVRPPLQSHCSLLQL